MTYDPNSNNNNSNNNSNVPPSNQYEIIKELQKGRNYNAEDTPLPNPESFELDYCIPLGLSLNSTLPTNHETITLRKCMKNTYDINLPVLNNQTPLNFYEGFGEYDDTTDTVKAGSRALFRCDIVGNPNLLQFIQKYSPRLMSANDADQLPFAAGNNGEYDLADGNNDNIAFPKPGDGDFAWRIDAGFYLDGNLQKILSYAIPVDPKNHIYTVLFLDVPSTTWNDASKEENRYHVRRDAFRTYIKSNVPDTFDDSFLKGIENQITDSGITTEIYDKIGIDWTFATNIDFRNPVNCGSWLRTLGTLSSWRFLKTDYEFHYDWRAAQKLQKQSTSKEAPFKYDEVQTGSSCLIQ